MKRRHAIQPDHQHLARLDVPHPGRVDQIERARLGADDVRVAEASKRQRPKAMRVADRDELVFGQKHQGEGALRLRHRFDKRLLNRRGLRPRVKVQQHLRVARRLENRSLEDQPIAQFLRVDQVAVVTDGDLAVRAVDQDRLRVLEAAFAGCGVANVPDRARAGQRRKGFFGEIVGDIAHGLVHPQAVAVGCRDADAFLAAMLERVEAEVREIRGLRVAEDPEDAALFSELVHSQAPAPSIDPKLFAVLGLERRTKTAILAWPPVIPATRARCERDASSRRPRPTLPVSRNSARSGTRAPDAAS